MDHDGDSNRQSSISSQSAQFQSASLPAALNIPKSRSFVVEPSSHSGLQADSAPHSQLARLSLDAGTAPADYDLRSPLLSTDRDTGLRRIRQPQPARSPSSPNLQAIASASTSPVVSAAPSRKASLSTLTAGGPQSPNFGFGEDLSRFPSESLHSFSFAHQSSESLHSRQNVLKRSIEFMRDKLAWAASSPRIANAQARLAGDEELLTMMELLQRANMMGPEGAHTAGLGLDRGPLTGPTLSNHENPFEKQFGVLSPMSEAVESPTEVTGHELAPEGGQARSRSISPILGLNATPEIVTEDVEQPAKLHLERMSSADQNPRPYPPAARRTTLKRTYTDVAGLHLQHKLSEAMAQPYHANEPPSVLSPTTGGFPSHQQPTRGNTLVNPVGERAPHGRRNEQAQAIFTTEDKSPWTITAANDLACLVFGVTRAEVRKLGILEVIREDRRTWLEEKLRDPESSAVVLQELQAQREVPPSSRETYQNRRNKTEIEAKAAPKPAPANQQPGKSRGVLLCGDVVPIQKMNGATGSASLWVKEKSGGLIWVLEEIVEDVAYLTVDEIGSVIRGTGSVEAIWGIERARRGMDVQKLIPSLPKLPGTNTGALDYDRIASLQYFTARTANSISIPITVEQVDDGDQFRVSSFPHIAGIMVLSPATMRVSSSNSVFAAALFGHANPDGLLVTDLIPGFDKILHIMTDEDKIGLVDGIVIPEHSFRRARALLALREGSADAASIFLRPSGLPAMHRDGAEVMIDVQMRVVKSDREPIYNETLIEDEQTFSSSGGEVVYALWITYSRQLHAVNHGVGPFTPAATRPNTPPMQPGPSTHPDESIPSPLVGGLNPDGVEETPLSLLGQALNKEAKASITATEGAADSNEPFEHPSQDMIKAGAKIIPKKKIEDFAILEEMGQGAYGQVKLARYKKAAAKKMVIKYVTKRRILVDTWHRDRRLGTVPLEIHVLDYLRKDGLQHPNIVEMADFFEDDINYYIEMVPHGLPGMDLFDYIELRVTMEERECRKIFRQVAEAIRHLHIVAKVVHRDIKDENVILDGEGKVKLVDFGSAAYIKSGPFDVFVGTIDYAAPEVLRGSPYRGKEQDVWALGILLYTIVYKENPFYSIDEIMDHDLRVPYVMSEDCIDLIRKMLDRDVESRISIQAVLDHPWTSFVDPEDE
ncbi:Pkinase-domain-containing protein [Polychaeton citri CBS 116435]|uniref:non-specific serine/threonine protein kinase n=1 Tax=Polychaeton citri CBS 116435 TaxID=1314669 RepID=A0A9P4PY19_9PEZI|nr:Pkinase-domain-containing protein [Polychaeton citri CBS 116435]